MENESGSVQLNLYQRISNVIRDIEPVAKNSEVSLGARSYKGMKHDDVLAALRSAILKHGIICLPSIVEHSIKTIEGKDYKGNAKIQYLSQVQIELKVHNIDKPEEFVSSFHYGYGFDPQDKGIGKAESYAVKYGMLKTFMIETLEDDEQRPDFYPGKSNNNNSNNNNNAGRVNSNQAGFGSYIIPIGQNKGKKLSETHPDSIKGLMTWLNAQAASENKKIEGPAAQFMQMAQNYLNAK